MVRARLQDGTITSSTKKLFGTTPVFFSLKRKLKPKHLRIQKAFVGPPVFLATYFFDCFFDEEKRTITYRPATTDDLPDICKFVDFWLSGGAKRLGIPGGGQDYFVPKGQQIGYLKYKTNYLAIFNDEIIGWSVKSKNETLIHLLVTPEYRGKGVGGHLLKILNPFLVRSKSDQSTGDPKKFYEKHGYKVIEASQGKHKNIDILQHPD